MSSQPQRDIEKSLLAYQQRRGEQLGAPLELHPATRRMLQSEAARAASRPLLTSEEAAKNFVRSFVMSHQQPGFFARHKRRVIWGGALFACLAVVLAVLRNDPQQAARRSAFSDTLPTPAPAFAPPAAPPPQSNIAANQPKAEASQLTKDKLSAPAMDKFQEVAKKSAVPASAAAPASPRPISVATAPLPAVQLEWLDRRMVVAAPTLAPVLPNAKTEPAVSPARMPNEKLAEQPASGEGVQLAKALKDAAIKEVKADAGVEKSIVESKSRASLELKRAELSTVAGAGGGGAAASPVAARAAAEVAHTRQQFLQLDSQAGYRKNFNSPPVPQVLQDFAFERTGDRVRIVDTDGSTYEGTVLPASAEALRMKGVSQLDGAKERKDIAGQQAQPARAPTADAQLAYRFYANGVNRKLKQSVEFRGEWQPPTQTQAGTKSALQPVTFSGVLAEKPTAEKKEKAAITNLLSGNPAPAQNSRYENTTNAQNELSQGRISGRAIVGGRNEFDINAVPK